jgi:predicted transcriptional regulator
VPAGEVDALVRDLFHRFTVCRFYADPFKWQSWLAAWAGEFDAGRGPQDKRVIEWRTNRPVPMAAAVENFDTAIRDGQLSHDGDPRLLRHVGNARRHELTQRDGDGRPLWVIRKDRHDSPHKIDAAMAAILSWEARTDAIAAGVLNQEASVYLTRGVRTLGE